MKLSYNKLGRKHVLLRFTLSYLLLLLIPLIMGIGAYIVSVNILEKQNIRMNEILLENSVDRIESSLIEAINFSNHTLVALDSLNVLLCSVSSPSEVNANTISKVMKIVPPLADTNGLINRYFIYHLSGEFIIEPQMGYLRPRIYYDSCFKYGNITYDQWRDTVLKTTACQKFYTAAHNIYFNSTYSSILMTLPYSAGTAQPIARLVFFIDEQRLHELLFFVIENGATYLQIIDDSGIVLSSIPDEGGSIPDSDLVLTSNSYTYEQIADGKRMIVSYYKSATFGWTYMTATPREVFINQATAVLKPIFIGLGIMLFVGILLIMLSMYYNRRPLQSIVKLLPLDGMDSLKQGLWRVEQAVKQITSTNEELKNRAAYQYLQLHNACINQLINGIMLDEQELETLLQYADIHIESQVYRGVYLWLPRKYDVEDHLLLQNMLITEQLEAFEPNIQILTSIDARHYIMIMADEDGRGCDRLRTLYNKIKSVYGLDVIFYVGLPCRRIEEISISYESARYLINVDETGDRYLFVAEKKELTTYQYDQEEMQLVKLADNGRLDEIFAILETVYNRNFIYRKLDSLHQQFLYGRLVNTLLLSKYEINLPWEFKQIPIHMNPEEFFSLLRRQYAMLCELAMERKRAVKSELVGSVIDYIKANFCNPDMGLAHLSNRFSVTENYLSILIKQSMGITFSAYLEQLRANRAEEMLKDSDMSIRKIAEAVGYINIRTFQRAFRRAKGNSPSQIRNRKINYQ